MYPISMRAQLKLPRLIGTFLHEGDNYRILLSKYETTSRVAILIEKAHVMHLRLSVNVPDVHLEPDEFLAKFGEEGLELRDPLMQTGLFEDTGERVARGFDNYEVWKLRPGVLVEETEN